MSRGHMHVVYSTAVVSQTHACWLAWHWPHPKASQGSRGTIIKHHTGQATLRLRPPTAGGLAANLQYPAHSAWKAAGHPSQQIRSPPTL